MEYSEATAIRRATRLVKDSGGLNFSVLNFMAWVLILATLGALIGSLFK